MANQLFVVIAMRQCYDCIESLISLQNTNSLPYFPRETPQPKTTWMVLDSFKRMAVERYCEINKSCPVKAFFFYKYMI